MLKACTIVYAHLMNYFALKASFSSFLNSFLSIALLYINQSNLYQVL